MFETIGASKNVLQEIIRHKRVEVVRRKETVTLESLRGQISPSARSLHQALAGPETAYILECKRSSPSRGTLRDPYDPVAIARSYRPFASALSVLVDERFFGGSFEHLHEVRERVEQPILLKDFIVDPYQIYEARRHGADAVLLLLSVLDDVTLRSCLDACRKLGMDALCETIDAVEIERAVAAGARIIGINHRDLHTMKIDRSRVERLAGHVPRGIPLVAESAIDSRAQVLALQDRVDGFLIGSALMREPGNGLDHALRGLIFGRTKICGLTRPEDAARAWKNGATHLGVVLAPSSRRIGLPAAKAVFEAAPLGRRVGVFVNEDAAGIVTAAERLSLDIVQLHGDESVDQVVALRAGLPPAVRIWRAVSPSYTAEFFGPADALLFDPAVGEEEGMARGGTGCAWDWSSVAARIDPHRHAGDCGTERWLAGGLTGENVARAVSLGFDGLDVSSGVESAAGIKDLARMQQFFSVLRGQGRSSRS